MSPAGAGSLGRPGEEGASPGAGPPVFPFSAVVGHDEVKLALLLAAIDPAIGGVLLRGQKGSAKTTLARGLASLLPGQAPFVELPVGASEDRVVGSLDLAAALTGGGVRFQPGLLAAAHGGVLYVDEVNLLPDHLVDVLLDVAASGVNRVEREGVSHSHQSRFVLVGSMNPEEGELRPQLLDRFGLAVEVAASQDPAERAAAVRRRLEFDRSPREFSARWEGADRDLAGRLAEAAGRVGPRPGGPAMGEALMEAVCSLCADLGAEGLRADLVICRAASALAAWEGRGEAGPSDVRRVAGMALAHRRRRSPFEEPGIDAGELESALEKALGPGEAGQGEDGPGEEGPGEAGSRAGSGPDERGEDARPQGPAPGEGGRADSAGSGGPATPGPGVGGAGSRPPAAPGEPVVLGPRDLGPRRGRLTGPPGGPPPVAGRRAGRAEGVRRGRTVGSREPQGPLGSVALAATVKAAAGRWAATGGAAGELDVGPGDLREAVREENQAVLVVLAVDASGSMGAPRRMEAAKGAVLSLLLDAYQRRDRIALVTFGGEGARLALRPTASVEVARARLASLPTGGRTPLAEGITTALRVAEAGRPAGYRPLLVLVSDGRATEGRRPGQDPLRAALEAAGQVRRQGMPALVVDAEEGFGGLGLGQAVADAMGAAHVALDRLTAGGLAGAVRQAQGRARGGARP